MSIGLTIVYVTIVHDLQVPIQLNTVLVIWALILL